MEEDFNSFDFYEIAGIVYFWGKGDPSFPAVHMNSRGGAFWSFPNDENLQDALKAYHADTPVNVQSFVRILRRLRADMLIAKDQWRENCRKATLAEQRNGSQETRNNG